MEKITLELTQDEFNTIAAAVLFHLVAFKRGNLNCQHMRDLEAMHTRLVALDPENN